MTERIEILGSPVDVLTMESAVERLADRIRDREVCQVVTANSEILYAAAHDPALFLVLHDAGLVTADGMGTVLASRLIGQPLPQRVAGYDLMHELAARAERTGWRFFLLGAKPEVLQAAVARLRELYPAIVIAGQQDGYFSPERNGLVVNAIKESKADILLVAMGAPKQDKWLHEYLGQTGAIVGIGIGGSFDILAGTAERAPLWMQRAGLEWLFRLSREPKRFWRMLSLPKFIWSVLWQKWAH